MKELLENKIDDKQLNDLLEKKINEGKNDKQILKELLGLPQKKENVQKYLIKDEERIKKNKLDIRNMFSFELSDLQKLNEKQKQEQIKSNKQFQQIDKMQKQMELLAKIEQNSNMKKLSSEPLAKKMFNFKLDQETKENIQMNLAIIKQDVLDMQELPPKEYTKREKYDIKTYEYIKDEEIQQILSVNNQTDSNLNINQILNPSPINQKKISIDKNINTEKNIDKKNQNKIQKNINSNNNNQLILNELKELAIQDTDNADKQVDIFYTEAKPGDRYKRNSIIKDYREKENPQQKQLQKYTEMLEKHDFDVDDLEEYQEIQKERMFQEKNQQEINEKFKKRMEIRELNKKRKKVEQELEGRNLNENIDFDQMDEKVSLKIKKDENNMPDLEQLEKAEELLKIREKQEKNSYEYHRQRTTKNYEKFMEMYFFENNKSSINRVSCGQKLILKEVVTNNALTVCYVFWDYLEQEQVDEKITEKIKENLEKYSKMLRGLMCQKLQLKYAPELRFIKSDNKQRLSAILKDMKENIPKVILQDIEDDFIEKRKKDVDYNKVYSKQDLQEKCQQYFESFKEGVVSQYSHEQQLQEIYQSKRDRLKFDKDGKRIRNNRNEDGSRKKTNKNNKSQSFQQFWDKLQ